jgi:hypothetical protein
MSCGTPYTDLQAKFVEAVEDYLRTKDCQIFTVGRHNHSTRLPVEFARDLIKSCDSAVVIAFERYRIDQGVEKPGSKDELELIGQSEPTVWNHLEAAMAYAHDLPILILVDCKVKRHGMLSKRFEWNALEVDIDPDVVKLDSFRQIVDDWLNRVQAFKTRKEKIVHDLEEITVGEFISGIKAKQAWAILGGAFAVLAAVAGVAFYVGQWFATKNP